MSALWYPRLDGTDENGHPAKDPHLWLDPIRLATIADALAKRLGEVDPAHAADYTTRAANLHADLAELDMEYATGLSKCQRQAIVTGHEAFGYLADRYKPQADRPRRSRSRGRADPAAPRRGGCRRQVHRATTIFFETLVSPKIAETIAREADLLEVVAVGEVAEGLMPVTIAWRWHLLSPVAYSMSSSARSACRFAARGGVVGGVCRVDLAEALGERVGDRGEPDRVEPQVRVLGGMAVLVGAVEPGYQSADIEGVVGGLGLDRGVDGGLEPVEVDDERRVVHPGDLPGRQLEVVRLSPRLRQRGDAHSIPADPRGDEGERVERSRNGNFVRIGRGPGGPAGTKRQGGGKTGEEASHELYCLVNENDCQNRCHPFIRVDQGNTRRKSGTRDGESSLDQRE